MTPSKHPTVQANIGSLSPHAKIILPRPSSSVLIETRNAQRAESSSRVVMGAGPAARWLRSKGRRRPCRARRLAPPRSHPWIPNCPASFEAFFFVSDLAIDEVASGYQRLLQLPRHPPPPRTSLMISNSISAPTVALMIAAIMPEPRWMPS
jgi:hypothetical protein